MSPKFRTSFTTPTEEAKQQQFTLLGRAASPKPATKAILCIDLLTIQKILGHSCLSTTARYVHVRRNHLQAAAGVLDLLPLDQLGPETSTQRNKPSRRRRKSRK